MFYTPKSKGMTLIEVLIALTITCLLALSVLPLYSKATYINRLSNKKNIATNAALSKIEELRGTDFDDLDSFDDSNFAVSEINGTGTIYVSNKDWNGDLTINDEERDLKNIKITVSWSDEGISKIISIPTLITKSGVNRQ
ncbi:hypothetical protein COZ22_03635 [bacterium (Candidatus Howlettbacteria) CG_4_10_14_3_um_filter_37_10]|nr:MAG: hypothetical protein COX25_03590 [bacterium (Candidatus Howlettbacteria) CG23_combo_of_CG06-09_8_20_14_all_37_9]PIX98985.1 MAG: hypothetical protein COZ22_03635 [bacterium (Candidatus Howlettbacteria) CG_4_10_14_3_um_filter_37_10]